MGVEEKKKEKKDRLIQAGTSLFSDQGFGVTTIDDITRQAGVAKGTFYLYFQDKQELMKEILQAQSVQHEENIRQLREVSCPRERLKRYITSELVFYRDSADLARFTITAIGPEVQSFLNWYLDTQKKQINFLAETISEGCEKGVFSVEDTVGAARFLRGAIFMFLAHQVFGPEDPQDIPSNTDFILRTFLNGVGRVTHNSLAP